MKQIATTLEQSKHLIELGVDENTADMAWNVFVDGSTRLLPKDDWGLTTDGGAVVVPAWSLTALLGLMSYPLITQRADGEWECLACINCSPYRGVYRGAANNPVEAACGIVAELKKDKKI